MRSRSSAKIISGHGGEPMPAQWRIGPEKSVRAVRLLIEFESAIVELNTANRAIRVGSLRRDHDRFRKVEVGIRRRARQCDGGWPISANEDQRGRLQGNTSKVRIMHGTDGKSNGEHLSGGTRGVMDGVNAVRDLVLVVQSKIRIDRPRRLAQSCLKLY